MTELHFRKSSTDIILLTEVLMGTERQYCVVGICSKCVKCNYFVLLMKSRAWPFIVMWPGRKPAFLRKEEGTRSWDNSYSISTQKMHLGKSWSKIST